MKILYVYGMEQTKDIIYNLHKLGYNAEEYSRRQNPSVLNDEEMERLTSYVKDHKITHLMSIHLIYNLAYVAYRTGIKYVSMIWDAPYIKLYTPFGRMDNCYFSVFDKLDCERFRTAGIPHILYQPLAVNQDNLRKWDLITRMAGTYKDEISFVGSLYDQNSYDKELEKMPRHLQDYFISIFEEAAFRWDGVNRIYGKTDRAILDCIRRTVPEFDLDNKYDIEDVAYFEILYLIRKIANIERTCVLNILGEMFPVTLYTNGGTDVSMLPNVKVMPPVEPGKPLLKVYTCSKINLNISLKGIEGGTPQRVMDIMGTGGFMMTNYCAETVELFEEDKEIVMFRTPEELVEKSGYYLSHDEEREKIAKAGYEKVLNCYTYEKKLKRLMEWVEGET
jgi:spore maturation protein CgeB